MTGTSTIGSELILVLEFRSLIEMLQLSSVLEREIKIAGQAMGNSRGHEEFNQLLTSLAAGVVGVRRLSDNAAILLKELKP